MPHFMIRHKVKDFGAWKQEFDAHGAFRAANGSKGGRVFRIKDAPNEVVVLFEWDSLENARKFGESQDLRERMSQAGVLGPPDVYFLEDVEAVSR